MIRARAAFYTVGVLAFAGWAWACFGAHGAFVRHHNAGAMDDIGASVVARVEAAIDYVVTANTELLIEGHSECGPAAVAALRRIVLTTAAVAEIHMRTPTGRCSAFDGAASPAPSDDTLAGWIAGRNPRLTIGVLSSAGDGRKVLGVHWRSKGDNQLVMAAVLDGQLFAALPQPLRERGRITLRLIDGDGDGAAAADIPEGQRAFNARSARYPIEVGVTVDAADFAAWGSTTEPWFLAAILVSSVVFGHSAARACVKTPNREAAKIERAILRGEIKPQFQPIIDLKTGEIASCEALARWRKPSGACVSPGYFIPIVERHGLDGVLFNAVLDGVGALFRASAAAAASPQGAARLGSFRVAINVAPGLLVEPNFAETLMRAVNAAGLPPERLTIELTERQSEALTEAALDAVQTLYERGFRIALDDVGVGFNGLATIQSIKPDYIKIDKFFIDSLATDDHAQSIVAMLVNVAARCSAKTVAEGVETVEQLQMLAAYGVDYAQGFYLGHALTQDDFVKEVSAGTSAADALDPKLAAVATRTMSLSANGASRSEDVRSGCRAT